MKFRRRILRRLRGPILALAALAALAPAAAVARPPHDAANERQSYAEQIAKLSPKELAAAFGDAGITGPIAKVGDTPADLPGASRAPEAPGPPTWPVDPQPIVGSSAPVSNTSASGFAWGSAAIGAAAVAALVAAFGGATGLRRRHLHQVHAQAADHTPPGLSAETGDLI